MPVTRSASKPTQKPFAKSSGRKSKSSKPATQTKLAATSNSSRKRAPSRGNDTTESLKKKVKLSKPDRDETNESTESDESIKINRSPVLQLWASTVAAFLYPDETWETCLSIGSSISTLCAVSKGKAIGQIQPKNKSPEQEKKKKCSKEAKKDSYEVEVMGFNFYIKHGAVVLDGKPKPAKESLLIGKFGGEETYEKVKKVMEDALQTWETEKDELNSKAFHMYEEFRPTIPAGQSGWGRKGELKMQHVKSAVEK